MISSDPKYYSLKNYNNIELHRNVMIDKLIHLTAQIIDSIWPTAVPNAKLVSTFSFIKQILNRSKATFSMLQLSLFYLFRIRQNPVIKSFCGRRLFLSALVISSKYLNDRNFKNSYWSKVAYLSLEEINQFERIFLNLINYNLYVKKSVYDTWVNLLYYHLQKKPTILFQQPIFDHTPTFVYQQTPNHTTPSTTPQLITSSNSPDNYSLISTPKDTPLPINPKKRTYSSSIIMNHKHVKYV